VVVAAAAGVAIAEDGAATANLSFQSRCCDGAASGPPFAFLLG
jgi:hypothetical protein